MREIGHFVGGKEVKGTSGRFGDVFNPNTGEVQAKVAFASRTEVGAVIANAEVAQRGWGATNPQRRARVMCQDEDEDVVRRLLAPPSFPGLVGPRAAHRTKHVPSENPRTHILE